MTVTISLHSSCNQGHRGLLKTTFQPLDAVAPLIGSFRWTRRMFLFFNFILDWWSRNCNTQFNCNSNEISPQGQVNDTDCNFAGYYFDWLLLKRAAFNVNCGWHLNCCPRDDWKFKLGPLAAEKGSEKVSPAPIKETWKAIVTHSNCNCNSDMKERVKLSCWESEKDDKGVLHSGICPINSTH